jgi:hypothetical protein
MLSGVALLLSASLVYATDIDAKSFRCITKMTPVRQFYVDNLQGNLDATLAAANSTTGAVYPPGSSFIDSDRGGGQAQATGASAQASPVKRHTAVCLQRAADIVGAGFKPGFKPAPTSSLD